MAQAIVAAAYGGPEVLTLIDEDVPSPGAGQVAVDVRAIGVNPWDVKSYSGMFGGDPANLPVRIGGEAAGVVTAIGPDVVGVAVGDEVIINPVNGAYATELVVDGWALTPKPDSLDWNQAAGLMLTGATAVHVLHVAALKRNETVLIHGASGGVGLVAVQLALAAGATVIGTASTAAHELLSDLGAIPVNYGGGLSDRVRTLAPNGVDAALDMVGTDEAVDTSLELVSDRKRIITIAAFGRAAADGIVVLGNGPGADPGTEIRRNARAELARLAGEGSLQIQVAATFPLAEAAKAHRLQMSAHAPGKIVLVP